MSWREGQTNLHRPMEGPCNSMEGASAQLLKRVGSALIERRE
jgi:hypothetical protein